MGLTQAQFEAIVADGSKRVDGDVQWGEDEDHSPAVNFRTNVTSAGGAPLFICGSYNRLAKTLSFALIHRGLGRIYALDLGKDHHNPTCEYVGEKHKHRWNEPLRDKEAYVPDDITAPVDEPVDVWAQFCTEAKIAHGGTLSAPPAIEEPLPL